MFDLAKAEDFVKANLTEKRYSHSVRVAKMAAALAVAHGLDEKKAYLAGVLHDVGYMKKNELSNPALMHSYAGAEIARKLGCDDDEILSSILYHTTGRPGMTDFEKVIYLADIAEPKRDFPGVHEIRRLSTDSLDRAMIIALETTFRYLEDRGKYIEKISLELYDELTGGGKY